MHGCRWRRSFVKCPARSRGGPGIESRRRWGREPNSIRTRATFERAPDGQAVGCFDAIAKDVVPHPHVVAAPGDDARPSERAPKGLGQCFILPTSRRICRHRMDCHAGWRFRLPRWSGCRTGSTRWEGQELAAQVRTAPPRSHLFLNLLGFPATAAEKEKSRHRLHRVGDGDGDEDAMRAHAHHD
jgi:hypothetical protein